MKAKVIRSNGDVVELEGTEAEVTRAAAALSPVPFQLAPYQPAPVSPYPSPGPYQFWWGESWCGVTPAGGTST